MTNFTTNTDDLIRKCKKSAKREKEYERMREEAKGSGREEEVEKKIRKKKILDMILDNSILY